MNTENSATRMRLDIARLELAIAQNEDNPILRAKLCDLLSVHEQRLRRFEEHATNTVPLVEVVAWARAKSQQISETAKGYGATAGFTYEPASPADDPTVGRLLGHLAQLRSAADEILDADEIEHWTLKNILDSVNRIEKQIDRHLRESGAVLDEGGCDALAEAYFAAVVEWAKEQLPDLEIWTRFVDDLLSQPLMADIR